MGKRRLTRKELVKHIQQTMPLGLNEYEKLAFIEVEVAKHISFDEKYLWGEMGTSEKIYKLAKKDAQNPKPEIKRKLICITMAELFGYVAKEFGFEVRYQRRMDGRQIEVGEKNIFKNISEEVQEHICPVIGLSNGKFIEVDIQYDLERLQTRSKLRAFGQAIHVKEEGETEERIEILPPKLVEDTFRKIYGLKENEWFTDEYIMVLSAELSSQRKNLIEILDIFMNDPRIRKEIKNTRCIEANKIYRAILNVCYDKHRDKQFFQGESKAIIEECILSDDQGRKRYSFCIYAEDKGQRGFYIYSKKSRRMVKLSQEEIQQLTQQVMKVELKGEPTELKKQMIAFVNGYAENIKKPSEESNEVSLEDIFLDEDEEELE